MCDFEISNKLLIKQMHKNTYYCVSFRLCLHSLIHTNIITLKYYNFNITLISNLNKSVIKRLLL